MNNFVKNESGSVSVGFGAVLFVLLLSTGMAVDVARAHSHKLSMQNALDAATLHAALNQSEQNFVQNAQGFFEDNLTSVDALNAKSEFLRSSETINGTANGELRLLFGRILGRETLPISVNSTVGIASSPACIIALETSRGRGLTLNGGANVVSPECGVEIHTERNPAFILNRNVNLDVPRTCIAGDRIIDNNGTVDNIELNCEVNSDPYFGVFEEPDDLDCDFRNTNYNQSNVTLIPGVYCGNFNFNSSNTKVFFTGGEEPYILRGRWNVNGGEWSGDNVSFYFTDAQSTIQFNSGVKATLTPPTSGPYAGVFITEAPGLRNSQFILNDSRGFDFEGIIYLPSREIIMNGGATIRSRELQLVARSFIINSSNLILETPARATTGSSQAYISR